MSYLVIRMNVPSHTMTSCTTSQGRNKEVNVLVKGMNNVLPITLYRFHTEPPIIAAHVEPCIFRSHPKTVSQ